MNEQGRNYKCKDEELPVICEYALHDLQRDSADFMAFSPKFNAAYIADFESKIAAVNALVNPLINTADMKASTARLHTTMDGLIATINRVEGYLKLAKDAIPVSIAGFGISELRKKLRGYDAEGVLMALRLVSANIAKYATELAAVGYTDALGQQLAAAVASINADNRQQYELLTARKELVQGNLAAFNGLYAQLMEFCEVGKMLYKGIAAEKVKEYTFAYLLKQVRQVRKRQAEQPQTDTTADK